MGVASRAVLQHKFIYHKFRVEYPSIELRLLWPDYTFSVETRTMNLVALTFLNHYITVGTMFTLRAGRPWDRGPILDRGNIFSSAKYSE